MGNSSKIFYALVAVLLLAIGGLSFAIFQQRQASEQQSTQTRLEGEKQTLVFLADKSAAIVQKLPELKPRTEALETQLKASSGKLFVPDRRAELDSALKQAAQAARLSPGKVEDGGSSPSGAFIAHAYTLRMTGPINALPAFIEALARAPFLMQVAKVGVNAPDFKLNQVKLSATVKVFEAKDPMSIAGPELPESRLVVDTAWHQTMSAEDPVYGAILKEADALAGQINDRLPQVKEAAALERKLMGMETLVVELKSLESNTRKNRKQALDGLPALYARVQSSPLGAVAMVLSDQKVSYPETAGDD